MGIESINFNPQGTTSLDTNREIRVIQDPLDNATQSLLFELKSRFFVRNDEIQDIISKEKPRVVHFAGHGANSKGLILENKTGDIHFLNTEAFKDVLKFFDHQIECVVLNACYSEEPAQVIHQHINYVIGTRRKIQDKAAIAFTNQIGLLYYQKNISPYLPPAQDKFKVLMTSRQRPGKNLQALDLDVLSEEAALELLSELAGEERIESELEKIAITKFIPQTPTQEDISRVALGIPHLSHVATELIEYVDDENLIWSFIGLGRFYGGQGAYNQAEQWYEQSVETCRNRLGEQHTSVATSLNNLGELYRSQGRYSEAEPLLIQALDLMKQLLEEQHPSVATSLNNLAGLYRSQGKYEAVEPLLIQALEIAEQALGENHPHTNSIKQSLEYIAIMKLLQMPEEELRQILPPEAFEQLLQFKQQIQSET